MRTLYELPITSTRIASEVIFEKLLGRRCSLTYEFEENGRHVRECILFTGIEGFRCTYFAAIDPEIISIAYDRVVDFGKSDWLHEIISNLQHANADSHGLRHLVVYFDDGPAYEFICRDLRVERPKL